MSFADRRLADRISAAHDRASALNVAPRPGKATLTEGYASASLGPKPTGDTSSFAHVIGELGWWADDAHLAPIVALAQAARASLCVLQETAAPDPKKPRTLALGVIGDPAALDRVRAGAWAAIPDIAGAPTNLYPTLQAAFLLHRNAITAGPGTARPKGQLPLIPELTEIEAARATVIAARRAKTPGAPAAIQALELLLIATSSAARAEHVIRDGATSLADVVGDPPQDLDALLALDEPTRLAYEAALAAIGGTPSTTRTPPKPAPRTTSKKPATRATLQSQATRTATTRKTHVELPTVPDDMPLEKRGLGIVMWAAQFGPLLIEDFHGAGTYDFLLSHALWECGLSLEQAKAFRAAHHSTITTGGKVSTDEDLATELREQGYIEVIVPAAIFQQIREFIRAEERGQPARNASERDIRVLLDWVDSVAAQYPKINRLVVGLANGMGDLAYVRAGIDRLIADGASLVLPRSVTDILYRQANAERENAAAWSNAESDVTSKDKTDLLVKQALGIQVPLLERLSMQDVGRMGPNLLLHAPGYVAAGAASVVAGPEAGVAVMALYEGSIAFLQSYGRGRSAASSAIEAGWAGLAGAMMPVAAEFALPMELAINLGTTFMIGKARGVPDGDLDKELVLNVIMMTGMHLTGAAVRGLRARLPDLLVRTRSAADAFTSTLRKRDALEVVDPNHGVVYRAKDRCVVFERDDTGTLRPREVKTPPAKTRTYEVSAAELDSMLATDAKTTELAIPKSEPKPPRVLPDTETRRAINDNFKKKFGDKPALAYRGIRLKPGESVQGAFVNWRGQGQMVQFTRESALHYAEKPGQNVPGGADATEIVVLEFEITPDLIEEDQYRSMEHVWLFGDVDVTKLPGYREDRIASSPLDKAPTKQRLTSEDVGPVQVVTQVAGSEDVVVSDRAGAQYLFKPDERSMDLRKPGLGMRERHAAVRSILRTETRADAPKLRVVEITIRGKVRRGTLEDYHPDVEADELAYVADGGAPPDHLSATAHAQVVELKSMRGSLEQRLALYLTAGEIAQLFERVDHALAIPVK